MKETPVAIGKKTGAGSVPLRINRLFYYGWLVLAMATLVQLMSMVVQQSFGVFLKPMIDETGWGRGPTGGILSTFMAVQAIFSFVMGAYSDRYGIRGILIIAGLLVGLGMILVAVAGAPWQVYIFLGLMAGIGKGASYVPCASVITRWFPLKRGLVFAIMTSGGGLAGFIFPVVAGSLVNHYGWRTAFVVLGLMVWVGFLPAILLMRTEPKEVGLLPYGEGQGASAKSGREDSGATFKGNGAVLQADEIYQGRLPDAVRTYTFWGMALCYFVWQFVYSVVFSHMVAYATDIGASLMAGAVVLSMISGIGIPGRVIWGVAADRWGKKNILGICLALEALAMFSLLWIRQPWMLYPYAAFFGLTYAGCLPLFSALGAEAFGGKSFGAIFGALFTIAVFGSAVGPMMAGYIFDLTQSYNVAFVFAGIALLLAVALNSFIKIGKVREPGEGLSPKP